MRQAFQLFLTTIFVYALIGAPRAAASMSHEVKVSARVADSITIFCDDQGLTISTNLSSKISVISSSLDQNNKSLIDQNAVIRPLDLKGHIIITACF